MNNEIKPKSGGLEVFLRLVYGVLFVCGLYLLIVPGGEIYGISAIALALVLSVTLGGRVRNKISDAQLSKAKELGDERDKRSREFMTTLVNNATEKLQVELQEMRKEIAVLRQQLEQDKK